MKYSNTWLLFILSCAISSCAILGEPNVERMKKQNTFTITTNVEGAKIEVKGNYKKETFNPTNSKSEKGYYSVNTITKPKVFRTKLIISKENYDSEVVNIRKAPRPGVLLCDLCLFTPFSPIIDMWSPNFYKISIGSKKKYVELHFTQVYMDLEYQKIQKTSNIQDLITYKSKFPYSNKVELVQAKQDELELDIAVSQKSEKAIDNYITNHPNASCLGQANVIKQDYLASRMAYDKIKSSNDITDYIKFVEEFPNSIQLPKVVNTLLNFSFENSISENNLNSYLSFNKEFLVKYSSYLLPDTLNFFTAKLVKSIDSQITKKFNESENRVEACLESFYLCNQISAENPNLKESINSNQYKLKVFDLILEDISKLTDEGSQKAYIDNFKTKYSDFISTYFFSEQLPLISLAIENRVNFQGELTIYGKGYITDRIAKESDNFSSLKSFKYLNKTYSNYKNSNIEKINIAGNKGNGIFSFSLFKSGEILLRASVNEKGNIGDTQFYIEGKLVRENLERGCYREYKDGKNITFVDISNRIKVIDEYLKKENYRSAQSELILFLNTAQPNFCWGDSNMEVERIKKVIDHLITKEKQDFAQKTYVLYGEMLNAWEEGNKGKVKALYDAFLKQYPKLYDTFEYKNGGITSTLTYYTTAENDENLNNAKLLLTRIRMDEEDRINKELKKDEPKTISNLRISDVSSIGNTIYGRTWASSDGLKFSYDYSSIVNGACMIIWNKNTTKTNPAGVFINVEFKPMYGKCQIAGMSAEDGGSFFLYIFPDGHIERQSGERMELQ